MNFFYLASPYSCEEKSVQEARFNGIARVAGRFLISGISIFCPITHSAPIEAGLEQEMDWTWWVDFVDKPMMYASDGLIICQLPGWLTSKGIARERNWFTENDRPVLFFNPTKLFTPAEWGAMDAEPGALRVLKGGKK